MPPPSGPGDGPQPDQLHRGQSAAAPGYLQHGGDTIIIAARSQFSVKVDAKKPAVEVHAKLLQ
jgi:hypothetical protein